MNKEKNLFKWNRMITKPQGTKVPMILKPILQRSSSIPKDMNINNSNNNRKGSIDQIETNGKRYNSSKQSIRTYETKIDLIKPIFKTHAIETRKELIQLLNDENANNLIELDLSNYKLKDIVNLDKFIHLKVLSLACNQIYRIENLSHFVS
jgi:hypothetical protein